jgi:hypothetical protein
VADFIKLALTAKRLIDANGRQVTLIKYGNAPQDQDKPWRGRSEYHEAEVVGYAAFVPSSSIKNANSVKREVSFALFAADDDGGHELETFDAIDDDGIIWKIIRTELIAPASTRVLYKFEVTR